jgi:hypothetical protein
VKSESELRDKLAEILSIDARLTHGSLTPGGMMLCKAAAAKALLWALGQNDDDRWHITADPGPAIDKRGMARN